MTDAIDDVIERLDAIVDQCRANEWRAGYFAAMYGAVTKEIKHAIATGRFEDGPRMARLDRVFASRYIDAFDETQMSAATTAAWRVSFEGADRWRPTVVQQLLTGMNAHINLDLGIAAAAVAPGDLIDDLRRDFDTINDVLAAMSARFMNDVAAVSPWIGFLDRIGGRTDQQIVDFSIDVARDEAWSLATQLAPLPSDQWPTVISARDRWTADFGSAILHPGWALSVGLLVIRLRESNDVRRIIDRLAVL